MTTHTVILEQACRTIGVYGRGLNNDDNKRGRLAINDLMRSMLGNGIGPKLYPVAASTTTVVNGGLYIGGTATATLTLPSNPKDGDRFGFTDGGTFATYNLTINPNGRFFEGVTTNTVISTAGTNRTYVYTQHNATWNREKDWALSDSFILSPEVRKGFTDLLAITLAAQYNQPREPILQDAKAGWAAITRVYGQGGRYDPPVPLW